MPTFSVVTPVFNAEKWLPEMLQSVAGQTCQDWEHLLVDDGSTDDSAEIIRKSASTDPRVKLIRLPHSGSPSLARNAALDVAQGRYIAFLDADDLWLPEKLEHCHRFILENHYSFVYHDFRYISHDGSRIGSVVHGPDVLESRQVHIQRGIHISSVVIDRWQVPNFKFDDSSAHEDLMAWMFLINHGHLGHRLDMDLSRFRKSASSRNANKINAAFAVWDAYRNNEKLPFHTAAMYWLQYAWNSCWLHARSRPSRDNS